MLVELLREAGWFGVSILSTMTYQIERACRTLSNDVVGSNHHGIIYS